MLKLSLGDLVEADKAVDNVAGLLVLPAGRRLTRAFRLRRPGAAPLEAEVSARRLVDGRLQLAMRDLAERRRAAEALRESEERYERLAASAPDAIVVEASGRVVFVNPALRKLLGLQPSAAMAGRALADFLHPDERLEVAKAAADAAAAGPAGVRLATRMRRADGSTAEVEGTATAVTYRGRPAVQVLMREVVDDRPAAAGDVYRDALTGLTSPLLLPDRLSVAISQAYRHRARVGVVHVDVDGFSALNERIGRPLADRVLRAVARRLSHCVRQGDTAARLEADAFVLVLPGLHHGEDATRIGEKVLRALRKPFPLTDGAVPLTASVGIAVFPEDGEDAPALLASAEQSSLRAHEAGGDRLESSAPALVEDGYDALELEAGLRAALAGGSMALNGTPPPAGVLHYQPIFALGARRIVGVEALLRWQHPQMGLVFPQSFLSRSDFTGLILAIGPWILRTAAVQAREWQRSQRTLRLAVNLSPPELMKKTLPDEVKAVLEETGLPPRQLQLEVPEGHVVSDLPRSVDMLHRLKALGVLARPRPLRGALLLARPPGRAAPRRREARPRLSPRPVLEPGGRVAPHRGHRGGPRAQAAHLRAGSRDGRAARAPRAAGLRRGAGLPPRPPGTAGDARRPARGPRRETRRCGGAMSFGGRLETLDLSALLQTLAVGVASGRLTLTRLDRHAVLVLRSGRVVYASGGSAGETLAGRLLREKLVGETELMTALERQHDGTGFRRLGEVLVEMGLLAEGTLQAVVRRRMEELVGELLAWKSGFFRFEPVGEPRRRRRGGPRRLRAPGRRCAAGASDAGGGGARSRGPLPPPPAATQTLPPLPPSAVHEAVRRSPPRPGPTPRTTSARPSCRCCASPRSCSPGRWSSR